MYVFRNRAEFCSIYFWRIEQEEEEHPPRFPQAPVIYGRGGGKERELCSELNRGGALTLHGVVDGSKLRLLPKPVGRSWH